MHLDPAPVSLDDASMRLPSGVYSTLRTFDGSCVLRLNDHLRRLEQSSRLAGKPQHVSRTAVEILILAGLALFCPGDIRMRLIVDLTVSPGDLYMVAAPYEPPPASLYVQGVSTVTIPGGRQNPQAKLTKFIETGGIQRSARQRDAYEVLLVGEDGEILEGTSSNFYAVVDQVIYTATQGVLKGITRGLVLDEARLAGIRMSDNGIRVDKLREVQETFLTSSTRGIIPIIKVDGFPIGSGVPGPVTRLLMNRYAARVRQELESLSSSRDASSSAASGPSTSSPRS